MARIADVAGRGRAITTTVGMVLVLVAASCRSEHPPEAVKEPAVTTTTSGALAPAVDPGGPVTHGTLTVGGRERTYRLYLPSTLPDGPVPLFIGLHGGTGWADQFATTNHIEGIAESNGFIVVHPDGVPIADGRGEVWNGGICCGVAAREDVDDIGFIAVLVDELARTHQLDANRIYAFGHSNGGIMSYRLACELSDVVVGIGVVAGTLGVDLCAPRQPVSIIHVHGTADDNVPLGGGVGSAGISGVAFPPPADGYRSLAAVDGCPEEQVTTVGDVTTASREPCREDAAAHFVTIEGANHSWPGGTPIIEPAGGAGYADYDATFEVVSFLLSHPRPGG